MQLMDYQMDSTPIMYPALSWSAIAPIEPPRRRISSSASTATEFSSAKNSVVDLFVDSKGPSAPTAAVEQGRRFVGQTATLSESTGLTSAPSSSKESATGEVERIANQRIQLMAAKYAAGRESLEMVARLEILNRRLVEQAPLVTEAQVRQLESSREVLGRIQVSRQERARRLGIVTK